MKTAISLPDDTFEAVARRAAALRISRSQFFADAARRYLDELERTSLTGTIDSALAAAGGEDSARAAVAASRRLLLKEDDW